MFVHMSFMIYRKEIFSILKWKNRLKIYIFSTKLNNTILMGLIELNCIKNRIEGLILYVAVLQENKGIFGLMVKYNF